MKKISRITHSIIRYNDPDSERMYFHTISARISLSEDGKHWASETIECYIGGMEQPTDKQYEDQIIGELLTKLSYELADWGFTRDEILKAQEHIIEE